MEATNLITSGTLSRGVDHAGGAERRRAAAYPISRWYLRPLAAQLAVLLAPTRVRPVLLTACGLTAAAAVAILLWRPEWMLFAAAMVLVYWFFDRADGLLARRQRTASAMGAWLDANVDELVDVGLHVAIAAVAASQAAASWPWFLLIAFLGGKYLLMYGLMVEESYAQITEETKSPALPAAHNFLKRLYHLPGNADVRIHLLAAALATGWLAAELAIVAVYYNMRWIARHALVARRLGGVR